MKRKVITIDGLAACGKSTIAKDLANRLGFVFFSSGLLYRAVGYLALINKIDFSDEISLVKIIQQSKIELKHSSSGENLVLLDGIDISEKIRTPEVSEATSSCAQLKLVREALLDAQRNAFINNNIVTEGRDMGTVIFPEADLKFFIKTDEDILIDRRLRQLYGDYEKLSEEEVNVLKLKMKKEIKDRNLRDQLRDNSPTVPANDAIIVDNSGKTLTETLDFVYHIASRELCSSK